jgi:hypothetical protein
VRFARILALLLVVVLAGLASATYAKPPDPTWIAGYWDDHDFDDVVILLYGSVALASALAVHAAPPAPVVSFIDCAEAFAAPTAVDETASPRAPPLSVSAS